MPKRETHTAKDILDLAEHFRQSWREGQILRSWLKSHAMEILELFNDRDWSWENLGKVLTEAGITYQTGTAWTGENLRRNLKRAQLPGKRELKLLRMSAPEAPAPAVNIEGPTEMRGIAERQKSVTPEFQLIRRAVGAVGAGKAPLELASLPPRRPKPVLSDEDIHAIAIGRSAKR